MTSKVKVNTVETESGSTLTIGKSGDTVTLASGASESGFSRTGTVNWDTTVKTAAFTAVSANGYFIDTSSAAVTMTLPASPSAGDIVSFKDYANTFDTNNLTIARNGSNIGGEALDATISVEGQSGTLIYADATKGWLIVNASTEADLPKPSFMVATGGTITTCGDCKVHTFTSPGTFCVSQISNAPENNQVSYLVVAGGGGGGRTCAGGAGGAGGVREDQSPTTPYTASPLAGAGDISVTAQAYPITVGGGGSGGGSNPSNGAAGSNSVFSTKTSSGGGRGGGSGTSGGSGGSGGGGGNPNGSGGTGNSPPVSPAQGKNGGSGVSTGGSYEESGGGGGGATTAGANGVGNSKGGNGGAGATTSISGSSTTYGGGGGGGAGGNHGSPVGQGGSGGGGNGANCRSDIAAQSGTTNTGGGGGGGAGGDASGSGGSGIVIIRYKFQ